MPLIQVDFRNCFSQEKLGRKTIDLENVIPIESIEEAIDQTH